ncbi:hypothetical protein ACFSCX_13370 [Bacillus salitolerans]|uniref:Uncharacterized protein n=1 Tax=Bacillus salitolerans TaxID=1437434 RepID=A0ABW4LS02_9BACI
MLWIFFKISFSILLISAFLYDKRKKKFNNELKKSEGSHYVQSDLPEREYLTTSIDNGQSVNDGENL